jgi:hypothetical protein
VLGVRVLVAAALTAATGSFIVAGCARVAPSTTGCVGVPGSVMTDLGGQLRVAGTLRNGEMVRTGNPGSGYFISAELLVAGAAQRTRGPILTWVGPPTPGAVVMSVDSNARKDSRWTAAPVGVSDGGPAMRSRGCTYRLLGSNPNTRCIGVSGALASLCQRATKAGGS